MIELSPEMVTIIMFGGVLLGAAIGIPLAFVIGTVSLLVGVTMWGGDVGVILYARANSMVLNYVLLAMPLFIFMGVMLQHSGIAEKLFDT